MKKFFAKKTFTSTSFFVLSCIAAQSSTKLSGIDHPGSAADHEKIAAAATNTTPLPQNQPQTPDALATHQQTTGVFRTTFTHQEGLDTSSDEDETPSQSAAAQTTYEPLPTATTPKCHQHTANPCSVPSPFPYDNEAYQRLIHSDPSATDRDFTGVNLRDADLSEMNLHSVILNNAILIGANLRKNQFVIFTKFCGADLTGAHFEKSKIITAIFTGANLNETSFENADIVDSTFDKTQLKDTNFKSAYLLRNLFHFIVTNGNFHYARIEGCRFHNVDFIEADLRDAIICGSSTNNLPTEFDQCKFMRTNFTFSRMFCITFKKSLIRCCHQPHFPETWISFFGPNQTTINEIESNKCIGLTALGSARKCILFMCEGLDDETAKYLIALGAEITEKEGVFLTCVHELPAILAAGADGAISGAMAGSKAAGGNGAVAGAFMGAGIKAGAATICAVCRHFDTDNNK